MIRTACGREIAFANNFLTPLPPEDLAAAGVPAAFTEEPVLEPTPGSYVALVSPGGHVWLGRLSKVRLRLPGAAIIGLDLDANARLPGDLPAILTPVAPIGR